MERIYGFEPLLCDEPRIIILGSLPGKESLEHQEYYYSKSNRIWRVICTLTNEGIPEDYEQKKELLEKYHIVLWDYYESAGREGSNDNKINEAKHVDICAFLAEHPSIDTIAINGFEKYEKFGREVLRDIERAFPGRKIRVLRLPETSGLNVNHGWDKVESLAKEWGKVFECIRGSEHR